MLRLRAWHVRVAIALCLVAASIPAAAQSSSTPYALTPAPFAGQMPAGWTAKKPSAQTTTFSAPAGSAEAETSIWIRMAPRASNPDWTIDDYVADVQRANDKLPAMAWEGIERSRDGRDVRALHGSWAGKTTAGAETRYRAIFVFAEFPDYLAIAQYAAPQAYFDRLMPSFALIWNSLKPAGATTASAASRGTPFSIESPPYRAEMPAGWVAKRSGDIVIVEGAPGTEAYEMTIRIAFYDAARNTIDGLAANVRDAIAQLPAAKVTQSDVRRTSEDRAARVAIVDFNGKDASGRVVLFRQIAAVVDYGEHLVILTYAGPLSLHDKYAAAFEMVGTTLQPRSTTLR